MREFKADLLNVKVFKNRDELGRAGAKDAADCMIDIIEKKGMLNLIFASAASQNEFLYYLGEDKRIDWSKVRAFHMDEYIGIDRNHPETFSNYLKRTILNRVTPAIFETFNTESVNPQIECERYETLLKAYPPDIIFYGIGESCHLAFCDPPYADFMDTRLVKLVEIDETSQLQMVHDGCFSDFREVPKNAYTITIPVIMNAPKLFGMVPGKTKQNAIKNTLTQPISKAYPSTILRKHPDAILYIDEDSAALLD